MIHYLAKRKAIRALHSSIRRAAQIKEGREGVEAVLSWRRDATRRIASIWGEQDELYEAIVSVHLALMTARGRATSENEFYRILDEACEIVRNGVGELTANGHPRYNTRSSQLWEKVVIAAVSTAIVIATGWLLRPTEERLFGIESAPRQDPRQIKVDLDNSLMRFDSEYNHSYRVYSAALLDSFPRGPRELQAKLGEFHRRAMIDRVALIDSFLMAYHIAGGDTVGLVPIKWLSR